MSPIIVGLAGGSASGKTELAKFLVVQLRGAAVIVSQDWYYRDRSMLSPGERRSLNFDHPKAFDHALLREQLLAIKAGRTVRAPRYDYSINQRLKGGVQLQPAPVILLEGLLVLHDPGLRALLDLSVFVDVPADLRLMRRLRRDVVDRGIPIEETLRLYEHCVRSMHEQFIQPSARHATMVWSQETDREFPMRLLKRIRAMLSRDRSANPLPH
jgi:uridine kinase